MSDLLERLEARAAPIEGNTSLSHSRASDGDIVQLQSDPNNRTMYENLGFVMLRPSEAREWLSEVRPGVLLEQRKKARLITAIRRLATTVPQMIVEYDTLDAERLLSEMTTDELQQLYTDYCEEFGKKPHLPPIRPEKASPPDARMAGVETLTKPEIDDKLLRGQGYDPTREAR